MIRIFFCFILLLFYLSCSNCYSKNQKGSVTELVFNKLMESGLFDTKASFNLNQVYEIEDDYRIHHISEQTPVCGSQYLIVTRNESTILNVYEVAKVCDAPTNFSSAEWTTLDTIVNYKAYLTSYKKFVIPSDSVELSNPLPYGKERHDYSTKVDTTSLTLSFEEVKNAKPKWPLQLIKANAIKQGN